MLLELLYLWISQGAEGTPCRLGKIASSSQHYAICPVHLEGREVEISPLSMAAAATGTLCTGILVTATPSCGVGNRACARE